MQLDAEHYFPTKINFEQESSLFSNKKRSSETLTILKKFYIYQNKTSIPMKKK